LNHPDIDRGDSNYRCSVLFVFRRKSTTYQFRHLIMKPSIPKFISCDWGTSNLRLRLVDTNSRTMLKEIETNEGIAPVYHSWKNEPAETDRFFYYLSVLNRHIGKWKDEDEFSLESIPVLVSGMASSTIGIVELEYAQMPFRADGSGLVVKKIDASTAFPFPLFIISGASTNTDVMRGEETLLAGCDTASGKTELIIFPGTHSKHVTVVNGIANNLSTYMTGEFFDLLSRQSILAASVHQENKIDPFFFKKGIIEGSEVNLKASTGAEEHSEESRAAVLLISGSCIDFENQRQKIMEYLNTLAMEVHMESDCKCYSEGKKTLGWDFFKISFPLQLVEKIQQIHPEIDKHEGNTLEDRFVIWLSKRMKKKQLEYHLKISEIPYEAVSGFRLDPKNYQNANDRDDLK